MKKVYLAKDGNKKIVDLWNEDKHKALVEAGFVLESAEEEKAVQVRRPGRPKKEEEAVLVQE